MKHFLWIVSLGSLVGSMATLGLLASLLRSPPGGPFIGGAGVVLTVAAAIVVAVLLLTGMAASWWLRQRGDPGLWRLQLGWVCVVLLAALVAGLSASGRQAEARHSAERAWAGSKQQAQALEALLADPDRLAAHVEQHGVDGSLAGTWMSPLEVAVERGYTGLAAQMLDKGATVSENALVVATRRADRTMLAAMLAPGRRGNLDGTLAFETAFRQGRDDLLRQLADAGLPTERFVVAAIVQKLYLQWVPGDVDWRRARDSWSRADLPPALRQALEPVAARDKVAAGGMSEAQVLEVLNAVVLDPPAAAVGKGDRDDAASAWRFVRELHPPGVIVPPYAGKGFAQLQRLSAAVGDKTGGAGQAILSAAVIVGDVTLVEALVRQGYDLKRLENQASPDRPWPAPEHETMNAYLRRQGLKPPPRP